MTLLEPQNAARASAPRAKRSTRIMAGQALGVATRGAPAAPTSTRTASKVHAHKQDLHAAPAQPPAAARPPPAPTARVVRPATLPRHGLSPRLAHDKQDTTSLETVHTAVDEPAIATAATLRAIESSASTGLNMTASRTMNEPTQTMRATPASAADTRDHGTTTTTETIKEERKRRLDDEQAEGATDVSSRLKRHVTDEALRAYDTRDVSEFLRLAAMIPPTDALDHASLPQRKVEREYPPITTGVQRQQEAFSRISDFFGTRMDIGLDLERAHLRLYLEAEESQQGLFLLGSSRDSTSLIIGALLRRVDLETPAKYSFYHVKAHLFTSPRDLYGAIRHQLQGKMKLPPWRNVDVSSGYSGSLPPVFGSTTIVLVIESIDALVKPLFRSQATLDLLFRFLNRLVDAGGLKLLVIGHSAQTLERFSSYFGGFRNRHEAEYMAHLPQYTIQTMTAHIEAVATAALVPMGDAVQLSDVYASKVVEFAARKAAKFGQCELEPVLALLRSAKIRMMTQCRHDKVDVETDPAKWKIRYEHVIDASTKLFQHDYVHRVQCVGAMTQAVLLVLIDAGPCTEEELVQHVYDRHKVHVWILIIVYFRREKFNVALELLLSVPVVKTREIEVGKGDSVRKVTQYYALPTRAQFIEAAGNQPLIKLIL